jgi:malonyl-CoA O-methyltransferase
MSQQPSDYDAAEPTILSTQDGYDRWSAIYDDEDNVLIALESEHLPPLVGDVRGLRVADIGCGTGRHALALAEAGATVTAVDFSEGMLARARAKPGAERVRFIEHDLTRALPLEDDAFDRVLCCLVIEHIERLDPFFAGLARICRPGGQVILSAMHPAMMLRGVQAQFRDPATGAKLRPRSHVDQTVSAYVMAAVRAGLRIAHLGEHRVPPELAARMPRAEKYLDWPVLFLMTLDRE